MASAVRKKPITRNRESLTCTECRARKLKCDRELPCSSCVKRNDPNSCSYSKSPGKKEKAEQTRAAKAEARLQHLEQLVEDFVQPGNPGAGSTDQQSSHFGTSENGSNGHSTYTGATHYSAMLEDIEELRQVLGEEVSGDSPPCNDSIANETDVLFGGTPCLPLPTILSRYLPSRTEVDRCVAAYFRTEAIAAPFVHVPQFMRQYEHFWSNRSATSPLWISLLFSICHLSQSMGRSRPPEISASNSSSPNFSLAAAHCLAVGRYTRPQRFAVEALAIFVQAKVIELLDPSRDLGILFGTLVQMSYSMGYHKDPTYLKHLTPFEGEMRRRTWSVIMQLDLLVSFQMGLPNNVQFGSWDTRPPSNLQDSDIDERMSVLPTPRPDTEGTKITFYIAKHMLMASFDKILRHALSAGEAKPESELIALDKELRAIHDSVPTILHWRSISASITDPTYLIVTRKCVELMYQKCLCVLHRKYVTTGRAESVRICLDAGTMIVEAFLDMYPEFKPDGQFYADRWLFGSITWNDFLLGVMVLCLVSCQHSKLTVPCIGVAEQLAVLQMLRSCYEVCLEKAEESLGARRTSRLLKSVISQLGAQTQQEENFETQSSAAFAEELMDIVSATTRPETRDMLEEPNQVWNDMWTNNLFDTQEWAFLEECLNTNFDIE